MSLFICPLCHSPLQPAPDTWRCDASLNPKSTAHTFDVARQGYVNLLPVQQKKSKAPGDSQQSIEARQRFLAAGHYQPLQALIAQTMTKLLSSSATDNQLNRQEEDKDQTPKKSTINWLDIGCGDGYYTQAMAQIGQINTEIIDYLIAADISKPALSTLAKTSKAQNQLWYQRDLTANSVGTAAVYPLVTSAAHLPLRAQSLTGISSIFSPILPVAYARVLQEKGYLLIAKPDVGHLAGVREALFDSVREHDSDKFLEELAPYFELLDTLYLSCDLQLSAQDLADLLTMTPYSYRARIDKRQALLASTESKPFMTEARFVVYVLQKTAS